jgi:RNA polymerase sigma-70 factor, ECF subfamily
MPPQNLDRLTSLLRLASQGDREAEKQIAPLVYSELRKIAAGRLRRERPEHTLQTTDLVHEAYLRIFGPTSVDWQDRAHFFAVAARQMRFILIEHARKKPQASFFQISDLTPDDEAKSGLSVRNSEDLVALDEALRGLEAIDPRASQGVELRFFGGLTQQEVAKIQAIDVATVKRDWVFAKSWLFSRLKLKEPTQKSA